MEIADLLSPDAVMSHLKAAGKKQVLQEMAHKAAGLTRLPERRIFETLSEREKLGSTGMGQGIAIPHGRLPGIEKMTGLFAQLDQPVDFDAMDDQPVDLVFLLLAPEGAGADHLKALSRIARVLRDADTVAKIRGTKDANAIHAFLSETPASHAA
jgi:nitrogen PTS system EIIA component